PQRSTFGLAPHGMKELSTLSLRGRARSWLIPTGWWTSPIRTRPTSTALALSATRLRRVWCSRLWRCGTGAVCCTERPPGRPEVLRYVSMRRAEAMTEISDQQLRDYREEAETTQDEALSATASRPGWQRAKVLSVRLSGEEFEELARYAAALEVPASGLVRGWILEHLRAGADSPTQTVERISHELDQLRRQLAA